jgi:predicted DsbA family dithiol-disulfide isomerase
MVDKLLANGPANSSCPDTIRETDMVIEIYSDIICPWCYIGKRRFEKALALGAHAGLDRRALTEFLQSDAGPRSGCDRESANRHGRRILLE